jgi:hypothetical protein
MSISTTRFAVAVAGLAALSLGLGIATPANAASATSATSAASTATASVAAARAAAVRAESDATVRKLDPYVVVQKDGTFALTASASQAGVSQEQYDRATRSIEEINGLILTSGVQATPTGTDAGAPIHIQSGVNGLWVRWWGFELKLDSGNANALAAILGGGGGVGAVDQVRNFLLRLFGFAPAPLVGVIAIAGSAVLYVCNRNGTGINFQKLYVTPLGRCVAQ